MKISLLLPVLSACCLSLSGQSITSNGGTRSAQEAVEPTIRSGWILLKPTLSGTHESAEPNELELGLAALRQDNTLAGPTLLEDFLERRPDSAWAPTLHRALATHYDRLGRQSLAIYHWEAAWRATVDSDEPVAREVADYTLAHWVERLSVLGWDEVLDEAVPQVQHRIMGKGWLQLMFHRGLENHRLLKLAPTAYHTCGSIALAQVAAQSGSDRDICEGILHVKAPGTGFSLAQLAAISGQFKREMTSVELLPDKVLPTPCVLHLQIDHYVALLERSGDMLLVADPSLGKKVWRREEVLLAETSGFLLLPKSAAASVGRELTDDDAQLIRGRGYGNTIDDGGDTGPCPRDEHGDGGGNAGAAAQGCGSCDAKTGLIRGAADLGMPRWEVAEPFINLWISDTPVASPRADGKNLTLTMRHKQRHDVEEGSVWSPFVFSFGPGWNCNRLSFVEVDGSTLRLHVPGGGIREYAPWYWQQEYEDYDTGAIVRATVNAGAVTQVDVEWPDGALNTYAFALGDQIPGNPGYDECLLLSSQKDAQGRLTSYTYVMNSGVAHLTSVSDGMGTTSLNFQYGSPAPAHQVKSVSDGKGHGATFTYDGNGLLSGITDAAGIASTFSYGAYDWVDEMQTPYGTTSFTFQGITTTFTPGIFNRACFVDEPDGTSQHLFAYRDGAPSPDPLLIPDTWPTADIPGGFTWPHVFDGARWMSHRNSFHWGPRQYAQLNQNFKNTLDFSYLTAADAKLARMRHWLHRSNGNGTVGGTLSMERASSPDGTTDGQTTWFDYPNRAEWYYDPIYEGTSKLPSTIARVQPDGTSWGVHLVRNSLANLTELTEAWKEGTTSKTRTWTVQYAANGIDPLQIHGPGSTWLATFTYSGSHPHVPETVSNAIGTTSFTYDNYHNLGSITRPNGWTTTISRNAYGFIEDITESHGQTTLESQHFTWLNGMPRTHTDARGLERTFAWDGLLRPTRIDYDSDSTYEEFSYQTTVPPNDYYWLDPVAHRDRRGQWTTFSYTPLRQLDQVTDPLGNVTKYVYCDCGSPETVTRAYGTGEAEATTYGHDNVGNIISVVFPDGTSLGRQYDSLNRLVSQSDSQGTVTLTHDNVGRLISVQTVDGILAGAGYNDLNQIVTSTNANGVVVGSTFDALGRVLTRTYPDSGQETFGYTSHIPGPTSHTDPLSQVVQTGYDPMGRVLSQITVGLSTNTFSYYPGGDLHTLTDGRDLTVTWEYDTEGRQLRKFDRGNLKVLEYTYHPGGLLATRYSRAKGTTSFTYDEAANLTNVVYPTGTANVTLEYDALNRVKQMTDGLGISTYTWRRGNLLESENGPWTNDTLTYGWHATAPGLLTGMTLEPSSGTWGQSFVYDASRRIEQITSPAGQFDYTYHTGVGGFAAATRLPTRIDLPNSGWIARSYDSSGRMLSTQLKNSGGTALDASSYLYNQASQRTQLTRTDASTVGYTYDGASELLTAVGSGGQSPENLGYTYDPGWNMTQRSSGGTPVNYSVNTRNQITSDGTSNYYYDLNGNRTAKVLQSPLSGVIICAYDAENRLTSVSTDASYTPEYARWKSTFQYDGWSRVRVRQDYTWDSVTTHTWALASEKRYVYDGMQLLQERTSSGTPSVTYTRGPDLSGTLGGAGGIGGLLARSFNSSGGYWSISHYYHADGGGNITALVDSYHQMQASYRYDPFGRTLSMSGSMASANLMRFSSKMIHDKSGFYDFGFRFYAPDVQRWLNRDPIGELGGINLYGFVGNDPIDYIDIYGYFGWRDFTRWVPVLGSGLDAIDDFRCGRIGMGILNAALALTDLTGAGALVKGVTVGTFKYASKKLVKEAYEAGSSMAWDNLRGRLLHRGLLDKGVPTHHWLIQQHWGWPDWITNSPFNLMVNIGDFGHGMAHYGGAVGWIRYGVPGWAWGVVGGGVSYGGGLVID